MSTKRINQYAAQRIATMIADGAFEQLLEPFTKDENDIAALAFKKVSDQFSFDELVHFGFANRVFAASIFIKKDQEGDPVVVSTVHSESDDFILLADYTPVTVISGDLYELAEELKVRSSQIEKQKKLLTDELVKQLKGKTAAQAIKQWPDARNVITEVCGEFSSMTPKPVEMEPLGTVLHRFLCIVHPSFSHIQEMIKE